MSAAQRAGYRWPTVCGGKATCRTCVFTVVDGVEHLSDINNREAEALALVRRRASQSHDTVRLACQATTRGDVTVSKAGVRQSPGTQR